MKSVKSISILGRSWFRRSTGNSYFSAQILVNGIPVNKIGYQYGYGSQYLEESMSWLVEAGYISSKQAIRSPEEWAENNKVELFHSITPVSRKRDL